MTTEAQATTTKTRKASKGAYTLQVRITIQVVCLKSPEAGERLPKPGQYKSPKAERIDWATEERTRYGSRY